MGIPLFAKDKIIGVLNLDSRTPDFFNEEHATIAQTFANQAAIAMENTRLFEAEHKRRQEAEILSQATSALANTLDINSLFENILDWLNKIAPYDSASIMLTQGDTDKTCCKAQPARKLLYWAKFSNNRKMERGYLKQKTSHH